MSKPDERREFAFQPNLSGKETSVYRVTGGDIPDPGVLVCVPVAMASAAYCLVDLAVDSWLRGQDGSAA